MAITGTEGRVSDSGGDENIILNPEFDSGLDGWSGSGCKIELHDSLDDGKVLPASGKYFVAATGRTDTWNGVMQDITARLQRKMAYEVAATVRLSGANVSPCEVRATLAVQTADGRQQYIGVGKLQASDKDWAQLQGKFLLNSTVAKATIYIEGPKAGVDLLLDCLVVKHAQKATPSPPPDFENLVYGANIIENSNLDDGLNPWFPLGPCALAVGEGSPRVLPAMAQESLALDDEPLNGKHIHVTNRTQTWMGPAQIITDKLTLHATYQVSAWVRVAGKMNGAPQNINIAVQVDSQWLNGGQVLARDERWYEIGGSFRVETKPASRVMVYVQGPDAGLDLMVAGLQVFPVDRKARAKHLKKITDKVRKRDVVVKLTGADGGVIKATECVEVRVRQVSNSFPLGACIMRTNMDNEDFVDFFTKHFNWGVFGNELKWYWTEPQRGQVSYADADDLLKLCSDNGMCVRGHCIFWEVENMVQQWVKTLSADDLSAAVKSRIDGLLTRYKGKFRHYDVNNEMLHGSFYQDKLGKDIRATMFKTAGELDPDALLFVNDYNVEGMCDIRATPEAYIQQIIGLQEQGAPVGGVGLQGHVSNPVGPVIRSVLDRLAVLGLPLWFTELDVSAANEHVRADDLEVMLREAYAHPAVEGVMLWGFWELFMSRDDAHLVNAEGDINEAGRRLLQLKKEWLTHARGHPDDNGEFRFRGHHGAYTVDVVTSTGKISQEFTVDKDDSPMVLDINV
ncbi:endo-1,4-beta-xylanase 1 [Lolium perenne]|uniref:endo-1,4-beta-xylanase 1 n=1 Tax=Lolium perenne TaxID=4522 RepID=UPI0021EAF84E|nr:endo-1,4-beta-xylanase 1-like [Lolium perenne]